MRYPPGLALSLALLSLLGGCSSSTEPTADASVMFPGDLAGETPVVDQVLPDTPSLRDTALPPAVPPAADGQLQEWEGLAPLAEDPAGDALGALDVTALYAQSRGSELFLRLELAGAPRNLSSGPAADGTLRLELGLPAGQLTLDFRGRLAYANHDPSAPLPWATLGFELAPTFASTTFELKLDLAGQGVSQGQQVQLDFSGGDTLAAPVSFTLADDPLPAETRSPERAAGTTLRLASLNTQFDGLTDSARGPALGRLLRAAAADVYSLQEVFETEATTLAATLQAIDPHGDGAAWQVHRSGDTAVASRFPLVPLPQPPLGGAPSRFTGAALQLPGGQALVVFALRLTCCGYSGDAADLKRIAETEALAATVAALRQGALAPELLPFAQAPVVVLGDWNLVGSRTPLDRLLDPAGPGLTELELRHLVGRSVYTWRSDQPGSFPPGRLDLLTYGGGASSAALTALASFILDSAALNAATLAALGLERGDSARSDHLLLVADFQLSD